MTVMLTLSKGCNEKASTAVPIFAKRRIHFALKIADGPICLDSILYAGNNGSEYHSYDGFNQHFASCPNNLTPVSLLKLLNGTTEI